MKASKKDQGRMDLRGTPEEIARFEAACKFVGIGKSAMIRELCKAACAYVEEYCADRRWRTPALMSEADAAVLRERSKHVAEDENRRPPARQAPTSPSRRPARTSHARPALTPRQSPALSGAR